MKMRSAEDDQRQRGSDRNNGLNIIEEDITITELEIDDQYDHFDSNIEYLIENELFVPSTEEIMSSEDFKNLLDSMNTIYVVGCNNCEITSKCSTFKNCFHGGNYMTITTENDSKELILNPNRKSKDLIYECFSYCKCSSFLCTNRLVQYGPRKNLKIIDSLRIKGQKGLITTKSIPEGGFICEYVGEIITKDEAERRHRQNVENNRMNYIICLNEYRENLIKNSDYTRTMNIEEQVNETRMEMQSEEIKTSVKNCIQTFIDPSKKGNIGRYLNHSCEPNCQILSVRIDGPIPKLGIFSNRYIKPNEELCFHYSDGLVEENNIDSIQNSQKCPCYCGMKNCENFLPNLRF